MLTIKTPLASLLADIAMELEANNPNTAIELIRSSKVDCPETRNALAVAHMRAGNVSIAVESLRKLTTNDTGLNLRPGVPTLYKVNYAYALAAAGNVSGALSVLKEINDEENAGVRRLRQSIRDWKQSIGWRRRMWLSISGTVPDHAPVKFVGLPGDVDGTPLKKRKAAVA